MATAQQNVQNAVKRAVTDVREGDLAGFKENVGVVARQAGKVVNQRIGKARQAASEAAESVGKTAREHPIAAASILFGTGAIVGAAIFAAARPRPTALELMIRGLRRNALRTRSAFLSGWRTARRAAAW